MWFGEPQPFPERGSPIRLSTSGQQRYEGWSCVIVEVNIKPLKAVQLRRRSFAAPLSGGRLSIPGHFMWYSWRTQWQCDRFFSQYLLSPVSIIPPIFHLRLILLLSEKRTGKLGTFKNQYCFGKRGALNRRVLSFYSLWKVRASTYVIAKLCCAKQSRPVRVFVWRCVI